MDHKKFSKLGGINSRKNMSPEKASKISRKANRIRWDAYRARKKAAAEKGVQKK